MEGDGESMPLIPKVHCWADTQEFCSGLTCRFFDEQYGCLVTAFLSRKKAHKDYSNECVTAIYSLH